MIELLKNMKKITAFRLENEENALFGKLEQNGYEIYAIPGGRNIEKDDCVLAHVYGETKEEYREGYQVVVMADLESTKENSMQDGLVALLLELTSQGKSF
jgi:hypothetical protein